MEERDMDNAYISIKKQTIKIYVYVFAVKKTCTPIKFITYMRLQQDTRHRKHTRMD